MNSQFKINVFVDFDGTITSKDIGDEIFKEFGQFEPYHKQLVNGELKIKDYWQKVCSTIRENVSPDMIIDYAIQSEIDPYFKKFANYCKDQNIPITIISDGFDLYINPILSNSELDWIKVYSNKLINNNGKFIPYFPMASESCNCLSASCKRNEVLTQTDDDTLIIFIGDGYSDYCVAEHSDIIFAKKNLAAYCNKNRIPHYPFSSFFDVYRIFTSVLPKKTLRFRHQAKLLRKKSFEIE